jgi:predicted methyltransferase MtxX (methanogen marker protein 4)
MLQLAVAELLNLMVTLLTTAAEVYSAPHQQLVAAEAATGTKVQLQVEVVDQAEVQDRQEITEVGSVLVAVKDHQDKVFLEDLVHDLIDKAIMHTYPEAAAEQVDPVDMLVICEKTH